MRLKLRWLLVAGVVAGVGAALGFRRSMARIADLLSRSSRTVDIDAGTVEYATRGEGAALLVLHGAGGGFNQGIAMAAHLATKGYRLIAPSRFGYLGSSQPGDPTPARQADAYAQLLDKLRIRQTAVLAFSAGAWSALHFAVRHPERCRVLILLVPATKLPAGIKLYGGLMTRTLFRSNLITWAMVKLAALFPSYGATLLGTPLSASRGMSAAEKERVREILNESLPADGHVRGMKLDIVAAKADGRFPMKDIACPVLAISAEDDVFETAERAREIARAVPNGKLIVYPTGGHLLVGRYDAVMREVMAFLARSA